MLVLLSRMNRLPNFRNFDDPKRKNPYGWDIGYGSERSYPTFKTKREKAQYKAEFEKKFYSDRDALVTFDTQKWRKFLEFEKIAGGMGALEVAAKNAGEYVEGVSVTFEEAAAMKINEQKRQEGVNVKRIELYCRRFVGSKGNKVLSLYSHEDCQGWIDELSSGHGINSLENHLKTVKSVFNLAKKLGHINKSPAEHVTLPSNRGEKRFTLYTASEVQGLLDHIWQIDKPLAGVYALLFFTGLRISMVAPSPDKREKKEYITQSMININDCEIIIPPGIMKNHKKGLIFDKKRVPNLWPWIVEIDKAKIPEPAQTFNKRREKLCKEVGLKWSPNVHRRSCASYYAALHGKSRAADLLGNTEDMIVDHYQVATFIEKAEAYFNVFPKVSSFHAL